MSDNKTTNKRSILIVEDEASTIGALSDKLAREGFSVIVAKNGEDGLKAALSERPDLILLDLLMAVMDGITMFRKLRNENKWGKHVPVIILTNLSSDYDSLLKDITELKPSYYFVKADWKLEDMIAKIHELLSE